MFSKVFKYDFKYILRFWWIFAVTSLGVSVLGGFLLRLLIELIKSFNQESGLSYVLVALCMIGLFASIIALCVFPLASTISCAVRYYKNFFSDEGYLTFTLPVSRATLLNAKILNNVVYTVINYLILVIELLIIVFIGFFSSPEGTQLLAEFNTPLNEISWSGSGLTTAILLPISYLFSLLMSICVLYLSITIGSIISKKHKVLAGLGVYYGINAVISTIMQIIANPFNTMYYSIAEEFEVLNGYLLVALIISIIVAVASYCVNLYCIKNKLNLS